MKTRQLALDAILAAMCAVLGAVSIDLGNLKISFESLPVLLGALLFGPLDALAVGGVGNLRLDQGEVALGGHAARAGDEVDLTAFGHMASLRF